MPQAFTVTAFDTSSSSESLHAIYSRTVGSVSGLALPIGKFTNLLRADLAHVLVATSSGREDDDHDAAQRALGFALTYLIRNGSETSVSGQHYKGSLALLCVDPHMTGRGVGTALHDAAIAYLSRAVSDSRSRSTPVPDISACDLQLGSVFPRIFPGVPDDDYFDPARVWFKKKGWHFKPSVSIDLYRPLSERDCEHVPDGARHAMDKSLAAGITYGPPSEKHDASLLALQKSEFDSFAGWPDMFPRLLAAGRREDIECAFASDGQVIGATVAALAPRAYADDDDEGPILSLLAWPCTIGSRCGSIACVGISPVARGSGAGLGMVQSASSRLASRGADGCFVDWVTLDGFYERDGYSKWRGYWEASIGILLA